MNCNLLNLRSVCFFLSLFLISCSNKKLDLKILDSTKFYIPLKQNDTNAIKRFNNIFNNSRILYLKTPDSLITASINKIIYSQEKIFILDRKFSSVLCFDQNGNFLMQYGKVGLNWNEYKAIQDFDIDSVKNQVVIFSNENLSLYYYSLDKGAFIKKRYVGLYANSFCLLPFNQIIFYMDYKIDKKMLDYNILITDSNIHIIGRFLPFNSNLSFMGWSSFSGFLNKSNNQIIFTDAFNDSVFSYKMQNVSLLSYVNINSDSIKKNKLDHKKILNSNIVVDSSTSFLKNHFFINNKYIVFNYQFEKRTKIAIYKIKDKSLHILTAKNASDPLLILARNLLYLDNNNNLTFAISPDDILSLKQKTPDLFDKLSKSIKDSFISTDSASNFYLLMTHLNQ